MFAVVQKFLAGLNDRWSSVAPAVRLPMVACAILTAALVAWLVNKLFVYLLARSYVEDVADIFDLNKYRAQAIAFAVFVAAVYFIGKTLSRSQRNRRIGYVGLVGLLIGHSLLLWQGGEARVVTRMTPLGPAQRAEQAALERERKRAEQEERYRQAALEQERRRQEELATRERREQEMERCAKGFTRVDGVCQPNPPPKHRQHILETGYSLLKDIGGEQTGYGLYSYAILVNNDDRSAKFLGDVFGNDTVIIAIPPVEETAAQPSQTNILYIPLKSNRATEWRKGRKLGTQAAMRAAYAKNYYDYQMSRALLDHLCDSPAEEIKEVCEGDLSRGPYIFTYTKPASKVSPVPPPFLFIDLSDVHERAFPEIIAAFKAQVKREDISDGAKIKTLRFTLLNIALKAADWLVPVQKAMANIVYSPSGHTDKDKQ